MNNPAVPILGVLIMLALVAACATTKYVSIMPGVISAGEMRVTIGEGWLRAPEVDTPEKRSSSRTLSRENLDRDRLMLIPGIEDGQPIFRSQGSSAPLPWFEANMNSEQIATLVAQSMQQALWHGGALVASTNIRDHGFGGIAGLVFDLDAETPIGRNHRGFAGGFVHEDRLYVIVFSAESPEHFKKHIDVARQVIDSATVRVPTIKFGASP